MSARLFGRVGSRGWSYNNEGGWQGCEALEGRQGVRSGWPATRLFQGPRCHGRGPRSHHGPLQSVLGETRRPVEMDAFESIFAFQSLSIGYKILASVLLARIKDAGAIWFQI